jgi:hypothetical protein
MSLEQNLAIYKAYKTLSKNKTCKCLKEAKKRTKCINFSKLTNNLGSFLAVLRIPTGHPCQGW